MMTNVRGLVFVALLQICVTSETPTASLRRNSTVITRPDEIIADKESVEVIQPGNETSLWLSPRRRSGGGFSFSPRRRSISFSPRRRYGGGGGLFSPRRRSSPVLSPRRRSGIFGPRRRTIGGAYYGHPGGYYGHAGYYGGGYYGGGYYGHTIWGFYGGGYYGGGYYGGGGGGWFTTMVLLCCVLPLFIVCIGFILGIEMLTTCCGICGGNQGPNYGYQQMPPQQVYYGTAPPPQAMYGGDADNVVCMNGHPIPRPVATSFFMGLRREYLEGQDGAVGQALQQWQNDLDDRDGQALEQEEDAVRRGGQFAIQQLGQRWGMY